MRVQLQERSPGAPPRPVAAEAAAAELTYHRRVTTVEEQRLAAIQLCDASHLGCGRCRSGKCYDLC